MTRTRLQSAQWSQASRAVADRGASLDPRALIDRNVKWILILLFASAPAMAQAQRAVSVRWAWLVVSTPDFVGPFRGNEPGFKAPVPKHALPDRLTLERERRVLGEFEVIVTTTGAVVLERTLTVSGPEVERRAKQAMRRWRLAPAVLDGKPVRVRLRVAIEEGEGADPDARRP